MLKNHPRLNFYHWILMSAPNNFKLGQKHNFTQPKNHFLKETNNIVLEGGWIMK